jgi:nucleotide-binding universal stress UspA family protein
MVETGFKARPLFLRGHMAETIVGAANRKRVDLVIVGSRGLTGVKRYLLGGVSQKVLKYSERSVLVVKRH